MERKAETKAVKRALAKAGIRARVRHGRGTSWGWLYITVDPNLGLRDKVIEIAQRVTGRRGEYDGNISVYQSWGE